MMSTPPRIGNDEPERRKRSANAEEEDGQQRKKNDGGIDMGGEREKRGYGAREQSSPTRDDKSS